MNAPGQRIDWDAAKKLLAAAELALEKSLVADADRIEEVYRFRATQLAMRHAGGASVPSIPVLVFSLAAETYGIPLNDLAEVLPSARCTPVPRAPAEIAGVINLRGELRSVIDLRRLLSLPAATDESAGSILMMRHRGAEVGLKVGRVEKIQTIREDELASEEARVAEGSNTNFKGITRDKVIILNTEALRSHPVFNGSSTQLVPPRIQTPSYPHEQ